MMTIAVREERGQKEMPQGVTGFEHLYPHIARWVQSYGWIEMGDDGHSPSFIRALDEGGMVWESDEDDMTLDEALNALEAGLAEWMKQCGA